MPPMLAANAMSEVWPCQKTLVVIGLPMMNATGTDQFTISPTQTGGGTTVGDQEIINENINDSGTLQQDGGGTGDTGYGEAAPSTP